MKSLKLWGLTSALCLAALPLTAQDAKQVEQLQQQLQQMQKQFEEQQRLQRQQIEALQKQLEELKQQQSGVVSEQQKLKEMVTTAPPDAPRPDAVEDKPWRPTDPIRIRRGPAYLDLSFDGLFAVGGSTAKDIEGGTQLGGHDPSQRGFTVQNLELALSGAVDPYFKGQANIVFPVTSEGETLVEAEEAFLETTSLPYNLQVKAGTYFTEFGRLNPQHPHSWSFVDQPLVNGRFLGPDGLRNPGARVSWLLPTPFYSELFLSVQNSGGETAASFRSEGHAHGGEEEVEEIPFAFRHADNDRGLAKWSDLLFTPRYALSFDLTDSQTLLVGASGAFGPNSRGGGGSGELDTQIYGTDLTWKWKSPRHTGGFPFVQFQAEAMMRKTEVGTFDWDEDADGALADEDMDGFADAGQLFDPATGLPAIVPNERLTDYGLYAQLTYGFRKGWVAGMRFDYLAREAAAYENMGLLEPDNMGALNPVNDLFRSRRYRFSPNLTWFPTEFSKIRLQYNYDHREYLEHAHSVWLQFEFALGAHAAHKF